jgi:hypothetical protein
MISRRTITIWALLVLGWLPLPAGSPTVVAVDPEQGFVDTDTQVVVSGEGFEPGARAAFRDGGPFLAGSLALEGVLQDVVVAEGHAFVAAGAEGLQVVDVRDSDRPARVGGHPTPGGARRLVVSGHHAFVVDFEHGVIVFDVTNPADPRPVGNYETFEITLDVATCGDQVCVIGRDGRDYGLRVLDVRDPTLPLLVGTSDLLEGASRVEHARGTVFVAGGEVDPECGSDDTDVCNTTLQRFDVRDPTAPVELARFSASGSIVDLALSGDHAFLAVRSYSAAALEVVSVSDPTNPSHAGRAVLPYVARDRYGRGRGLAVAVHGSHAFVAAAAEGLAMFDVGDLARLSTQSVLELDFGPGHRLYHRVGLATSEELALVVGSGQFHSVDIEHAAVARSAKRFGQCFGYADLLDGCSSWSVDAETRRAYLFAYTDGLPPGICHDCFPRFSGEISGYDVGDPGTPRFVAYASVGGIIGGMDAYRGLLYAVRWDWRCSWGGQCWRLGPWFEVRDPDADLSVVWVEAGGSGCGSGPVAIAGRYALVSLCGETRVYDLEDPRRPSRIGSLELPPVFEAFESGSLIFAVTRDGFHVLDATDRSLPTVVATLEMPHSTGLAVTDDIAYALDRSSTVHVIDVSDPLEPEVVGSLDGVPEAWAIAPCGEDLCLAAGKGLHRVDVSEPTAPFVVGEYRGTRTYWHLDTIGENVFGFDGSGVEVTSLGPRIEDVRRTSDATLEFNVPRGFAVGPYDVLVTNPDGSTNALDNGYVACPRRQWTAELRPLIDGLPPALEPPSVSWMLEVGGDSTFFDPEPLHRALLLLPDLPEKLETRFEQGDGSGRVAIDIKFFSGADSGIVLLTADDQQQVTDFWRRVTTSGGFDIDRLDRDRYRELGLRVFPRRRGTADRAPVRYRFDLLGERLEMARAWGLDADLVFETTAVDRLGCERREETSFIETLGELCGTLGEKRPGLVSVCK